jgi:hypothetical protein
MRILIVQVLGWCREVLEETGAESFQSVFCGYHDGTVPSLALALMKRLGNGSPAEAYAREMRRGLLRIALPYAVIRSSLLQQVCAPCRKSTRNLSRQLGLASIRTECSN